MTFRYNIIIWRNTFMNRISETKFFNFANKKYNYNNKLSKINFKDYYIPSDLINDKLNNY